MPTLYTFRKLFNDVLQYRKELVWANIIAFCAVVVSIPIPLVMPMLVDEILLGKPKWIVPYLDRLLGRCKVLAW